MTTFITKIKTVTLFNLSVRVPADATLEQKVDAIDDAINRLRYIRSEYHPTSPASLLEQESSEQP